MNLLFLKIYIRNQSLIHVGNVLRHFPDSRSIFRFNFFPSVHFKTFDDLRKSVLAAFGKYMSDAAEVIRVMKK